MELNTLSIVHGFLKQNVREGMFFIDATASILGTVPSLAQTVWSLMISRLTVLLWAIPVRC